MSCTGWSLQDIMHNVDAEIRRDYVSTHSEQDIKNLMFIGLAEETGEVIGILKRLIRDNERDKRYFDEEPRCLEEEIGDVLWYLTGIAITMGINLDEVWSINRKKLEERYGNNKSTL